MFCVAGYAFYAGSLAMLNVYVDYTGYAGYVCFAAWLWIMYMIFILAGYSW